MKWVQVSDAVYKAQSPVVQIDIHDVEMLGRNLLNTPEKRIRICAHQAHESVHEMLIMIAQGSYIRPHKHLSKSESFHIVEGELDVILFDDLGQIMQIIPMGPLASGKCFFYRLSAAYFHTLYIHSDRVVFHETTEGPFRKEETVLASWAPEFQDVAKVTEFLTRLAIQKQQFNQG